MVEVEFNYRQNIIVIQGNLTDSLETIAEKYVNKANLDIDSIYFISSGRIIDKEDKLEKVMSESDKRNKKIIILVNSMNTTIIKEKSNIKVSKDVICPECKEICKYEMNNYQIKLYDCKNGHKTENIKLDEFKNKQGIDISKIKCDKCKNRNKSNTFNNEFYICYECNMNLCPLCKSIHDKKHSVINYDNKNYLCNKHNKTYIEYCENCNIDICLSCNNEHKNHKIISYEDKSINIENLRNKMNEFENEINKLKLNLEEIIKKFKKIMDNYDKIYNINNNILNNYNKNNRNYKLLLNLNFIDKFIDIEINNIKDKYDYGYNLKQSLDIYNYMEINNEIELIYKPKKKDKVGIFGSEFVKNNKDKCRIIYNNKEYELKEYFNDIDYNIENEIKIKLKCIKNVTDMSYMFAYCESLFSLPDMSKWNTTNVTNMSNMFRNCESLSFLPNLSKWNTSNVTNMSYMFSVCVSLFSLPDISDWDTSNVTNMSYMFYGSESLYSLPDISNWDTSNVTNMSWMFGYCKSLSLLPNLSKWNTSNVTNMSYMFFGCKILNVPSKFGNNY